MVAPFDADPRLSRITELLVAQFDPRRLVLFGSRARGTARPDSDYDLMLEVDEAAFGPGRAITENELWSGGEVDLFAHTPSQIDAERDDVGLLLCDIVREGRVVYQRANVEGLWPPQRVVRERPPDPPRSVRLWIEKAEDDYQALRLLVRWPKPIGPTVFHAHQGVEKLLKAALASARIKPSRTHWLVDLFIRGPAAVRDDDTIARACALLDDLFRYCRYPSERKLNPKEALWAVDAAEMARRQIVSAIASDSAP